MSNNKQIPTAEELFDKMIEVNYECTSMEMMIEFAKLHVEAALREASENAHIKANTQQGGFMLTDDFEVEKESILNSYPLDQIK